MRALLGVCLLLSSGCLFADEDDIGPAPYADATPGSMPDASPPIIEPPPPPPPFVESEPVPFDRDDVERWDFAYLGFGDGAEIRFGNLRGEWTVVLPIAGGVMLTGSLQVSPTGDDLAYESFDNVNGGWRLHVLSLTSFADRTVGLEPRTGIRPTWSPDGTRLLFYRFGNGDLDLQLVDLAGSAAPVTIGHAPLLVDGSPLRPDWSHDGREIFYSTLDRIVAHDVAAGTDRDVVIAPDGESVILPVLSPDGNTLAYAHGDRLELVDRAGGTPRVLAELRNPGRLVWRPDGASLAVVDDGDGVDRVLRLVDLEGVETHVDVRPGSDLEWSPDGSRLLYDAFAERGGRGDSWIREFHADAAVAIHLGLPCAGADVSYPTWLHAPAP
jgi:Tol biopolymer transport system component